MSFFSVSDLTVGYGGNPVLNRVSFSAESGRVVGILGANGSGKTTLIKAICGILPHTGVCTLCGRTLEGLSARKLAGLCGYIPQRSGISIDISVLDVVLMGFNPKLGLLERPNRAMEQTAREALELVGLSTKVQESYLNLSEGQKQLCILARTLISDSRLLLLDEPESALDFHFRYRLLRQIRHWVTEEERTALVALHDPMLALNECDELLVLSGGTLLGTINPRKDSLEEMERGLSTIYGKISLHRLENRGGKSSIVMLKEDEP